MDNIVKTLGNSRYDQLQTWLSSPAQRVRRVLGVTAAAWWPDGEPPHGRRAAARAIGAHPDGQAARRRHARRV